MWLFKQEQRGQVDADLAVIINNIAVACKNISNLVATAPVRGLVGWRRARTSPATSRRSWT